MPILSNPRHETFCQLIIAGKSQRAAYIEVFGESKNSDATSCRLAKRPELVARIRELQGAISQALLANTILDKQTRLAAMGARWKKLMQVVEERGKHPDFKDVAGGTTGWVYREMRGKDALVPVYRVDTSTAAELRAIEQRVAQELGEETQQEGLEPGGSPLQIQINFVSPG